MNRFPYKCILVSDRTEFIPTVIDFDVCQVWHQKGQGSENGEWYSFDEVYFMENQSSSDFVNYLLNSAINYQNGEITDINESIRIHKLISVKLKSLKMDDGRSIFLLKKLAKDLDIDGNS